VATAGWRRTLPAAFAPLISDGPIAFLVLTVLHTVARGFEDVLRGIGGVVFFYFAVRTFLEWRRSLDGGEGAAPSSPRTLMQAVVVNLLNPGPYLGWSLILGPMVLDLWAHRPGQAVALVVSFYTVIVGGLALFIVLVGTTAALGPRSRRFLLLAASIALAGIAVYSFWSALT
jgi:threonine/homoserine/homoserine lactone efflux protein